MKTIFVAMMILVGLVARPAPQNPNDAPHTAVPSSMLVLAGRIDYVPDPILSKSLEAAGIVDSGTLSGQRRADAEERLSLAMENFRIHDPAFFKGIMDYYHISLRERK